jgi:parallel beta-helix repeat protein
MTHIRAWGVLWTLFLLTRGVSASAATVCVDTKPKAGCYPTITAGIAAAQSGDTINVAHGTYREQVIIRKSGLSLIGDNAANTIIDAGSSNTPNGNGVGIYVDGMSALVDATGKLKVPGTTQLTGISDVVVQGFTVANAPFEGILATNAANVTIVDNHATGNNRNLVVPTTSTGCPFIPAWETSEGFDCGEGIHLAAVHHSTVANNIVDHNAGGILLTDETGPNHDNLITGNVVNENGYDCGITLASHRPPATTLLFGPSVTNGVSSPIVAYGVFRNTITGNDVSKNGLAVSGNGTGVGLFTSPGPPVFATMQTQTYDNVVIGNRITGNGQPGVAMHAHKAGAILTGNLVAGNYIADNGADVADTATAGPTGIIIHAGTSGEPLNGNRVTGNVIDRELIDIAISTSAQIDVHLNDLRGGAIGVANLGSGQVDARQNWWGCPGGPGAPGCSTVQGNNIVFSPWLQRPANPGQRGE